MILHSLLTIPPPPNPVPQKLVTLHKFGLKKNNKMLHPGDETPHETNQMVKELKDIYIYILPRIRSATSNLCLEKKKKEKIKLSETEERSESSHSCISRAQLRPRIWAGSSCLACSDIHASLAHVRPCRGHCGWRWSFADAESSCCRG